MAKEIEPFAGYELMVELHRLDLVPPHCRRVIIDIDVDSVAKVYYECNAPRAPIFADLVALLQHAATIQLKRPDDYGKPPTQVTEEIDDDAGTTTNRGDDVIAGPECGVPDR